MQVSAEPEIILSSSDCTHSMGAVWPL